MPAPLANPQPLKVSHPDGLPAGQATVKRYFRGEVFKVMNITLKILIAVFVVISTVAGCGIPFEKVSQPFYSTHEIISLHEILREGKTTEEYLIMQLGIPTIDGTDTLGNKKWIYLSTPGRGNEVRLDVIFKDGIVIDYKLDGEDSGILR